jgi:hypothetical protein
MEQKPDVERFLKPLLGITLRHVVPNEEMRDVLQGSEERQLNCGKHINMIEDYVLPKLSYLCNRKRQRGMRKPTNRRKGHFHNVWLS